MALVKCKECQGEVSTKAAACPHCGAKVSKGNGCGTVIVILFAILFGIGVLSSILPDSTAHMPANNSPSSNSAETPATPTNTIQLLAEDWHYSSEEDPMSKGRWHSALRLSLNTHEFSFPYQGAQHGALSLRSHPRHGKDVIFKIEQGQILCRSYEDCAVQVRFDDEPADSFSAIGPEDNSTETIFIHDYNRFVEKMMKSKRVRLSVPVYQQGNPIWEFDVSGFDKNKYLGNAKEKDK